MRLYEYINSGGGFWDNTFTYPSSITATVRDNITNTIKYRFAFHSMRKTLEGMAEDYNIELNTLVPSIIHSVMIANDYKYNTLYSTLNLVYDPIENYRMTETETVSGTHSNTDAHTGTDTRTLSNRNQENGNGSTEFETTRNNTNSNTNVVDSSISSIDSVFAFNSSEWENNKKNVTENGTTTTDSGTGQETGADTTSETHTNTIENSGTDALQHGETITTNGTRGENRTLTRSGNIGVTTSQQMIQSQRDIAMFSFVDVVTADIIKEMCINVT